VATIQFDFNQPEGFDLTCINEEGEKERIVMVHCAIMGSLERFLNIYIEHTAGRFPVWNAPEQLRILTVNQTEPIVGLAESIVEQAKNLRLRVTLDNSNESVGKKIRESELWKVPYVIVIGEKESETGEVTPRIRGDIQVADPSVMKIDNFLQSVANEARSRVSKSSL
jgi:threonyl-tRNA synthetase